MLMMVWLSLLKIKIIYYFALLTIFVRCHGLRYCLRFPDRIAKIPQINCDGADYQKKSVHIINYNFLTDSCQQNRTDIIAWNDYRIHLQNFSKIYQSQRPSFTPDCVHSGYDYVGNNIWMMLAGNDNMTQEITLDEHSALEQLKEEMCPDIGLFNEPLVDVDKVNAFLLERLGLESVRGYYLNQTLLFTSCTTFKPTKIIKSRKIGHVCYEKVPFYVGHINKFSTNGIDVEVASPITECFPDDKQSQPNYYFNIRHFIEITCILVTIFVVWSMCRPKEVDVPRRYDLV